ncbi:hypothetical protein SSS_02532 [Sarcoptes scabiei]|uniref:Uncharacterized protein n=1 Tax=Sarcoptes scabiei TaxID=52283 RepID=A0A834VEA9_SARSC|nr:hypothetical protein SSS_02532 [Sarcoptes scabiei]
MFAKIILFKSSHFVLSNTRLSKLNPSVFGSLFLIRSKFCINDRRNDAIKSLLLERFRMSEHKANLVAMRFQPESDRIDHDLFVSKLDLLQSYFKNDDLTHNLHIFELSLNEIKSKISIFQELGFDGFEIKRIEALPNIMNKTIEALKIDEIYDTDKDMIKFLLNYIATNIDSTKAINISKTEFDDSMTLKEVRSKIFARYLKKILSDYKLKESEIIKLIESTSITKALTNLIIFQTKINFSDDFIQRNIDFLATCDTDNLLKHVENVHLQKNDELKTVFFSRKNLINIDANTKLLRSHEKFRRMFRNNSYMIEFKSLLKVYFNKSIKEIEQNIGRFRKGRKTLNLRNAQNVLKYLQSKNLNQEQILNGIYLIYFELDRIQHIWSKMFEKDRSENINQEEVSMKKWSNHPFVLHLVCYELERETFVSKS